MCVCVIYYFLECLGCIISPEYFTHCKMNFNCSKCIQLLVFLVVGRAVLSFRFCVYETLFNPILSDSFGLNERDASYFFFGLVAAQICGTIVL